ncbi:MAG: LD-carboxypeptidase [bacterium]
MKRPPSLKKGDRIGIVAPARKISQTVLNPAFSIMEKLGFEPVFDSRLFDADRQFAGTDEQRAAYFQQMLNDVDIRAVLSARGGYGSVRIIDRLDLQHFSEHPKWIIGYSDMTVFLNHLVKHTGVQTLHASMPLNFKENTPEALEGLFSVLQGTSPAYEIPSNPLNRKGDTNGMLVGGNLSVLYSMLGSNSFPEVEGNILFLEDLDEYLYHIDRMMMALKRAGILEKIGGLLVGAMTDMNDNEIPFGSSAEEIIREAVSQYDYPVCFGFPAGHIPDNRPLIMGAQVSMKADDKVTLKFN